MWFRSEIQLQSTLASFYLTARSHTVPWYNDLREREKEREVRNGATMQRNRTFPLRNRCPVRPSVRLSVFPYPSLSLPLSRLSFSSSFPFTFIAATNKEVVGRLVIFSLVVVVSQQPSVSMTHRSSFSSNAAKAMACQWPNNACTASSRASGGEANTANESRLLFYCCTLWLYVFFLQGRKETRMPHFGRRKRERKRKSVRFSWSIVRKGIGSAEKQFYFLEQQSQL